MVQQILVGVLFLGALSYVGRLLYQSFKARAGCASGCGKCAVLDVQALETRIKKDGI